MHPLGKHVGFFFLSLILSLKLLQRWLKSCIENVLLLLFHLEVSDIRLRFANFYLHVLRVTSHQLQHVWLVFA